MYYMYMLLGCISSMECKLPEGSDLALLIRTCTGPKGLLSPSAQDILDTSSNSSF